MSLRIKIYFKKIQFSNKKLNQNSLITESDKNYFAILTEKID